MIFILKKILSALVLPPTGLILLSFAGLWLSTRHPKMGRWLTALSLATLLILSLPITGNALLQSLEHIPPISESQLKDIQAIVILGGGKNEGAPEFNNQDTVNRSTLQRLRYGAYLQRITGQPILATGGAPFGGTPEAETMAETLRRDFFAKDILVETQSKDTAENAAYSAKILKELRVQRIALVSQAWHLSRAKPHFEQAGLAVSLAPTGFTTSHRSMDEWLPSAGALERSSIAIKEYLGILISRLIRT